MDPILERRVAEDRREFAIYYRYGCEHRNNSGNRRLETVEKLRPYYAERVLHANGLGSDREFEILKGIADAFGANPDTLEILDHDATANSTEECQTCEDQARMNAELKTELAASRRSLELCRNQVTDLLPSFS